MHYAWLEDVFYIDSTTHSQWKRHYGDYPAPPQFFKGFLADIMGLQHFTQGYTLKWSNKWILSSFIHKSFIFYFDCCRTQKEFSNIWAAALKNDIYKHLFNNNKYNWIPVKLLKLSLFTSSLLKFF